MYIFSRITLPSITPQPTSLLHNTLLTLPLRPLLQSRNPNLRLFKPLLPLQKIQIPPQPRKSFPNRPLPIPIRQPRKRILSFANREPHEDIRRRQVRTAQVGSAVGRGLKLGFEKGQVPEHFGEEVGFVDLGDDGGGYGADEEGDFGAFEDCTVLIRRSEKKGGE